LYNVITKTNKAGGEKMTTISNSKLKCFNRCQRQYYYKFIMGLQAKKKKEVLERGSLVHECLEHYYLKGGDPQAMVPVLKSYKKKLSKMFDEERVLYEEIPHEVAQIMRGYHRHWKTLDHYELATYQGKPIIETAFEIPLTKNVILGITLDRALEDDQGIWVQDTKTAKNLPSDNFRTTDTQSTLYEWGLEKVMGIKSAGMIWDYVRTKVPTEPQLLVRGGLSKNSRIDTDQYTYLRALKKHGLDRKDYEDFLKTLPTTKSFYHRIKCPRDTHLMRETLKMAMIVGERIHNLSKKSEDYYTRSISYLCDRDCEFRELCSAEMQGSDTKFMVDHYFEPRKEDKYGDKAQE
jgi:hypothetical protein